MEMPLLRISHFILLLLLLIHLEIVANISRIPGHKRPFGTNSKAKGVTAIGRFSSPPVFYRHFVNNSLPIHMKSALQGANHPGLTDWTDDYFRNHFGVDLVRVEMGKKEVRGRKAQFMRFNKFLDAYKHSDLYMVHSVSGSMKSLVQIPVTLQCGGFQRALQEAVIWMGQGTLESVLHYDELDNLLCLFDGTKDIVLIDQVHKDKVEATGFDHEGHYSHVNMDSVDMHKFPGFENLPWYRVHMEAGDCVYIPNRWYHQVKTFGDRSLAVNIWFSHLWKFDDEDCANEKSLPDLKSLIDVGFASPNEALRSRWLEAFQGTNDDVGIDGFRERVSSGSEEHKDSVFDLIDFDGDELLSWNELYRFDISHALLLYPDVFQDEKKRETLPEPSSSKSKTSSEPSTVEEVLGKETVEEIISQPEETETDDKGNERKTCVERDRVSGKCESTSNERSIDSHEKAKWTSEQKITNHEDL